MSKPILSQETKTLLDKIKTNLVNEFPIQTITPIYFILAILDNISCDGYKVIEKILINEDIESLKEYIQDRILKDCTLDIVQNSDEIKFDAKYDKLANEASNDGEKTVTSAYLLHAIVSNDRELMSKFNSFGVTMEQISDTVFAVSSATNLKTSSIKPSKSNKKKTIKQNSKGATNSKIRVIPEDSNIIENNCINMIREASKGVYDSVIGLDDIVNKIFDTIGKYERNVVAIIGPHGVGKTSIVERMAKLMYEQKCPEQFRDKYIMKFGDNINNMIINEMNSSQKYIAFIDDMDRLFINKESEANNIYVLSELFKCSNVSTIICIDENVFSKSIESRPDVSRYIQKIKITEPNDEQCFDFINSCIKRYEDYHIVKYNDNCIKESIRLAKRFITNEKAPMSALNILDLAGSICRTRQKPSQELVEAREKLSEILIQKNNIPTNGTSEDFDIKDALTREEISIKNKISSLSNEIVDTIDLTIIDIRRAVSQMTGIPVDDMDTDEKQKLKNLNYNLSKTVIGQDDAVSSVCKAVRRQRIGLSNPQKPCVMLFLGKTGTGKSLLAKRLANEIYGDEKNMVRLDMSEYSDKTSVTKLYGASAGYIGYEEGGVLTEAIKKKPCCVLLLDEIEKAHQDVYNVFLQVFDEGRLSDNKGNLVDFRNVIIIMTSNIGAKDMADKTPRIGFGRTTNENIDNKEVIMKAIKKEFKPEFINRIDNICIFNSLTDDNLKSIIKNEIAKVRCKVQELGFDLDDDILTGKMVDSVFEKVKEESEYGARPILREIQKQLEDKLTDYIIDNDVKVGYIFKYNDIYCI